MKNLCFALFSSGASVALPAFGEFDELCSSPTVLTASSKVRDELRLSSLGRRALAVGTEVGRSALGVRHTNSTPSNLELWNRMMASESASAVL